MATTGLFVFSVLFLCQALSQSIDSADKRFEHVNCTNASTVAHPNPCQADKFIICFEGYPNFVMKCGSELIYNETSNTCDRKPLNYTKPEHCRNPTSCSDVGFDGSFIEGKNCTYFIVCHRNPPEMKNCPAGSYFKYEIQNCAWPAWGRITAEEIQACKDKEDVVAEEST